MHSDERTVTVFLSPSKKTIASAESSASEGYDTFIRAQENVSEFCKREPYPVRPNSNIYIPKTFSFTSDQKPIH